MKKSNLLGVLWVGVLSLFVAINAKAATVEYPVYENNSTIYFDNSTTNKRICSESESSYNSNCKQYIVTEDEGSSDLTIKLTEVNNSDNYFEISKVSFLKNFVIISDDYFDLSTKLNEMDLTNSDVHVKYFTDTQEGISMLKNDTNNDNYYSFVFPYIDLVNTTVRWNTTILTSSTFIENVVNNGLDGEFEGQESPYDLIISDLMLPGENGFEVIKYLRKNGIETPVLILTAKSSLDDKIEGFNVGADDYLTKPFYREELLVRVKALLRRAGVYSEDNMIAVGDVLINLENRGVQVHGQQIKLVGKEFDILTYLAQNKNIIVTRDQIFDRVWGIDSDTTINVVNIYLNNLRRKLESVGQNDLIKTLRNIGFILEVKDA